MSSYDAWLTSPPEEVEDCEKCEAKHCPGPDDDPEDFEADCHCTCHWDEDDWKSEAADRQRDSMLDN